MLVSFLLSFLTVANGQRLDGNQEYQFAFTEATKHFLFGNYVQAVNLYKECLRIKPQSSAAHYQLSKVYLNAGNIALAREHAKQANEYTAGNKWYLQALGDIYQMEEKYDSAIIIYNKLLAVDRDNVNIVFAIASLYEKNGNYDKALNYLSRIDEQIGLSKEVSLTRYRIYESQNLPGMAIEALKAASALSPDEYALTGMIAEFYQRHNMKDSAELYYREVFPKYRSDVNVVFSYANFLLESDKTDSARLLVLEVMNDRATDHITKSGYFYNVLRDEENFRKSVPIIDTVTKAFVKGNESDIRSLSVYADVFLRLRKYSEATWALIRIVEADQSNYPALEQLIYTLNILGKTDSVLLYANRALKLNNDKPVIYLFTGSAYYQKKDYNGAINALNTGMSLTNDNALKLEFYSLLAESYQEIGKYSESENAFKSGLAIDKDNLGIKNNFAYYLSLWEKNLQQARKMSLATIKAEKENSTYLDTYAWILFKMGKTARAKKFIIRAIEAGGNTNDEILSHSAEIHIKAGDYSEALKYLDRIAEMPDEQASLKARERIREVNSLMNR